MSRGIQSGEHPGAQGWVRFVLPHLVTRLTWQSGTQTYRESVSLVNVSASGALVLVQVDLPPDGRFMISFEDGTDSTGPIPAVLVGKEETNAGKTLARFQFASVQSSGKVIRYQKERRAWRRMTPKEKRVFLFWHDGDRAVSVRAELKDISGGGAAVWTETLPPANQSIWLSVGKEDRQSAAECRLVGSLPGPTGKHTSRFAFIDVCPYEIYAAALGLSL